MQWKISFLAWSLSLLLAFGQVKALACDDGSCDDGWSGLYATGGYDLLNFGLDLYDVSSLYSGDSWGGGCASFTGNCGSAYDLTSLYGDDSSYSIDIDITYLLGGGSYNNPFGFGGGMGGFSPFMGGGGIGGFPPFMGGGGSPFLNFPPYSGFPPFSPFSPLMGNYPPAGFPVPTLPPWGGCDGVIVACPTGPLTPPVYTPGTGIYPGSGPDYTVPRGGPVYTPPTLGNPGSLPGGILTHGPDTYPTGTLPGGIYTPPSGSTTPVTIGTSPYTYNPPGGSPTVYTGGSNPTPTSPIPYTVPRTGTPSAPPTIYPSGSLPTTYPMAGGGASIPVNTAPSGGGSSPTIYSGGTTVVPTGPTVYSVPRTGP